MIIGAIYFLGALHGLVLSMVLVFRKVNQLPNRLLSFIMIVFSIDLGMAAYYSCKLEYSLPGLIGFNYTVTLLYGPLLFLYVKSLCKGQGKLHWTDYLHFIPFLVLLAYMVPFYLAPVQQKILIIHQSGLSDPVLGLAIITHMKLLHGLGYVGAVLFLLMRYRQELKNAHTTTERLNLKWLQNMAAGIVLLAITSAVVHIIASMNTVVRMGIDAGMYDDITLIGLTVFIYGIGYMGLYQSEAFGLIHGEQNISKTSSKKVESLVQHKNVELKAYLHKPKSSYDKSGLNAVEAQQQIEVLKRLMEEERLYRNNELSLDELVSAAHISQHNLTEIINKYLNKNFYEYVNGFRVEEVKMRLQQPESENLTFLAIGLEAGFNSKSTFNSAFKKITGMTPSQYRRKYRSSTIVRSG